MLLFHMIKYFLEEGILSSQRQPHNSDRTEGFCLSAYSSLHYLNQMPRWLAHSTGENISWKREYFPANNSLTTATGLRDYVHLLVLLCINKTDASWLAHSTRANISQKKRYFAANDSLAIATGLRDLPICLSFFAPLKQMPTWLAYSTGENISWKVLLANDSLTIATWLGGFDPLLILLCINETDAYIVGLSIRQLPYPFLHQ